MAAPVAVPEASGVPGASPPHLPRASSWATHPDRDPLGEKEGRTEGPQAGYGPRGPSLCARRGSRPCGTAGNEVDRALSSGGGANAPGQSPRVSLVVVPGEGRPAGARCGQHDTGPHESCVPGWQKMSALHFHSCANFFFLSSLLT